MWPYEWGDSPEVRRVRVNYLSALCWLHDAMPEKLLDEGLDLDSNICHLAGSGIEPEGVPVSVLMLPSSWRMHRGLDIAQTLLPALGHRKGSPVLSIAGLFHHKNQ